MMERSVLGKKICHIKPRQSLLSPFKSGPQKKKVKNPNKHKKPKNILHQVTTIPFVPY